MGDLIPIDGGRLPARLPRGWGEIARYTDGPNPMLMVPPDFLDDLIVLWSCNRGFFPTCLELCARLRIYAERGLTAADLRGVVRQLVQPERAQNHRFASDVLADLAALASEAIRRRRLLEEMIARRDPAGSTTVGRVLLKLSEIFRPK